MQLPEHVDKMLCDIAHNEGFCEFKCIAESGSNHGDNIHGVLTAITMIGNDQNSNIQTLHLMCKMSPASKAFRDSVQSWYLFKREIFIYTRLLPAFVEFQQEKGLCEADSFVAFPKVYATHVDDENESYALIMEDMRSRNFVLWPRHEPMPLDHEKKVLETLAKLHGVSLAMKDQRPTIFAEFKTLYDVAEIQIEHGDFGSVIESALEQSITVLENEDHKKILQECRTDYRRFLNECFGPEAIDRFGVINHGDCWINNILLQYADNTREVANVCMVDWQFSRYSSPAPDILYYIFSSTRKQQRDQHYNDLIRYYYTALSDMVRKLGSDPDTLFRFCDLEDELKAAGKFVLILGTLLVQYAFAQANDVRNVDEYCDRLAANNKDNNNNDERPARKISLLKDIRKESDLRIAAINEVVADVIAYGYFN